MSIDPRPRSTLDFAQYPRRKTHTTPNRTALLCINDSWLCRLIYEKWSKFGAGMHEQTDLIELWTISLLFWLFSLLQFKTNLPKLLRLQISVTSSATDIDYGEDEDAASIEEEEKPRHKRGRSLRSESVLGHINTFCSLETRLKLCAGTFWKFFF